MDATLKFNLPEDSEDLKLALDGWKYRAVIHELDYFLGNKSKHEDVTEIKVDEIRKLMFDKLEELNLTLE